MVTFTRIQWVHLVLQTCLTIVLLRMLETSSSREHLHITDSFIRLNGYEEYRNLRVTVTWREPPKSKEGTTEDAVTSTPTQTRLPDLDREHEFNAEAPIQHLNRLSRASYMIREGILRTWHGDGAWKWANETAQCSRELPGIHHGGGDTGTSTPIHNVSTPTSADNSMRRTRSRVVEVSTVMQGQQDTLQAVDAALATGPMPFGSSGLRQKRKGTRETMTWDVGKSVAVPEVEGLGRNSKTRRLLPIVDSPTPLHTGPLDLEQPELITAEQGLLGEKLGEFSIRTPAAGSGDAQSLLGTGKQCSAQVGGSNASDWATCSICRGRQDQESILTCQGCSLRTHLDCYFTEGSKEANDTITEAEEWRCEECGGFERHIHPRPVQVQRQGPKRLLRPRTY